ncbi:hypothetical protein Trydic_g20974 [Trypoxylus dichotomus]
MTWQCLIAHEKFFSVNVPCGMNSLLTIPQEPKKMVRELLIRAFFGHGDEDVCDSPLYLLVSESYSNTHDSSPNITLCTHDSAIAG